MKKIIFPLIYLTITAGAYADIVCSSVTPTINTTAYTAGDCLHATAIEIPNASLAGGTGGYIRSIRVADKQGQGKNISAVFFKSAPSTICTAINAGWQPADADLLLITAGGPISISSHDAFHDNGVSMANALGRPYVLTSGTSLYMGLIAEEAVTYAVGDLTVEVCVDRER